MSRVSFQVTSGRGRSFVAWIRAARWAGVVPQHPPRRVAMGASFAIWAA